MGLITKNSDGRNVTAVLSDTEADLILKAKITRGKMEILSNEGRHLKNKLSFEKKYGQPVASYFVAKLKKGDKSLQQYNQEGFIFLEEISGIIHVYRSETLDQSARIAKVVFYEIGIPEHLTITRAFGNHSVFWLEEDQYKADQKNEGFPYRCQEEMENQKRCLWCKHWKGDFKRSIVQLDALKLWKDDLTMGRKTGENYTAEWENPNTEQINFDREFLKNYFDADSTPENKIETGNCEKSQRPEQANYGCLKFEATYQNTIQVNPRRLEVSAESLGDLPTDIQTKLWKKVLTEKSFRTVKDLQDTFSRQWSHDAKENQNYIDNLVKE